MRRCEGAKVRRCEGAGSEGAGVRGYDGATAEGRVALDPPRGSQGPRVAGLDYSIRRMRTIVLASSLVTLLSVSLLGPTPVIAQAGPPPAAAAQTPPASAAPTSPAASAAGGKPIPIFPATMKELMVDLIFPTSNELFYVSRNEPKTDGDWMRLEMNFLALAESANVLMAPPRARDQGQWMKDGKLLLDVAVKAYRYAKARDYAALTTTEMNEEIYEACQACHVNYRPGYKRRP